MKKKKLLRIVVVLIIAGGIIGGGSILYIFNKPHRDVLATEADYSLTNSQITTEYLANKQEADEKYLASDGNSKILEITGTVRKISENLNNEKIVLLREADDKAGVSATFTSATNHKVSSLEIGEKITIKGVIRSGASYDEDLGLYENVILEKSDLVGQL